MADTTIITNDQLVNSQGETFYVILWDHVSQINGVSLDIFHNAYPWTEDSTSNVILVLKNNDYMSTQRVENPEILRSNYSLAADATIDDIMNALRQDIYNQFQQEKAQTTTTSETSPTV